MYVYALSIIGFLNNDQPHVDLYKEFYKTEQQCIVEAREWAKRLDPQHQYKGVVLCQRQFYF